MEKVYKEFETIQISDYTVTTKKVSKLALSSGDIKRYWLCHEHCELHVDIFSN